MTAHDQIRAMLDELMGTGRDGTSENKVPYSDPTVCRSYLVGCCPHDILQGTRMDMGPCHKIHDPALKADYEKEQKRRDHFYDLDALDHLERFFEECDRKTEIAKRRLEETQEELTEDVADKVNIILEFNEKIGKALAEAEQLGNEGKVDESLTKMNDVENLKKQKQAAEIEYRNSIPASHYQQQKLRVCEVCSAYLGINDNDRRLADHFGGKLHMGFVFLRERFDTLRASAAERRAKRLDDRRSRDKDSRSSRDHRSRDLDYDRRRKSRSRSKDRITRPKERRRSRSREKERRSHRHRSRSRSRSADRHRGSKKHQKHRSRSSSREEAEERVRESREKSKSSLENGRGGGAISSKDDDKESGECRYSDVDD